LVQKSADAASSVGVTAEDLPVQSLREAAPHLRRPFTPEAIKFKVQTVFSGASGCLVVAYIDARLVIERLNKVIPDHWQASYERVAGADKLLWCHLTVDGVTRSDVGESPKGMSKDLVSDALKRAAVQFGISVSTYALPQITLYTRDSRGRIEVREVGREKKKTVVLTEHGHQKLREGYRAWLETKGAARFGEPLDHGDVEGATLEVEELDGEFEPAPAAPLEDDRAKTLIAACRSTYEQLAAAGGGEGRKRVPPGTFNGWLAGASHSHDELARLLSHLEGVRDELRAQEAEGSNG
jgi:hypothetical protein